MYEEAKKQLKEITLENVKATLKKLVPAKYDKMIINENSLLERADIYYSSLKYKIAEKELNAIKFPLFEKEKFIFAKYQGGVEKLGEKKYFENPDDLSKMLNFKGLKSLNISINDIPDAFDYPLLENNGEIIDEQRPYFIPLHTYSETCNTCNGEQYVTCPSCNGEHKWKCPTCSGTGKIGCKKCNGHGYNKCWSCSGTGYKIKTKHINGQFREYKEKCSKCHGKGEVPCTKCNTSGQVTCPECRGKGEIVCEHCYGDAKRYGMVDCPECLTAGVTAQLTFVIPEIKKLEQSKIHKKGDDFEIPNENLELHFNKDLTYQTIYKNVNGKIFDERDEISDMLMKIHEKDINYSKNAYPMLIKEDISYQVVPNIRLTYKHMLTNTEQELLIINFWDNPDILFLTDAEKVKTNVKSVTKSIKNIFGKVLKSKKHKQKVDKKTEIKLMIYLAKADGIIEEEEKIFLSEHINDLNDFTNSDKKELFNLMNINDLPELTHKDINFSTKEKAIEVINKLEELAKADGNFELSEKKLIEKVKKLITENYE